MCDGLIPHVCTLRAGLESFSVICLAPYLFQCKCESNYRLIGFQLSGNVIEWS